MKRTVWGKLGLLSAGAVAGLVVAEVVLRAMGFSYGSFGRADDRLGYAYIPGASGGWTEEGHARVRINGQGYRDEDFTRDKPPGTFRIAVLGDSYMAGFGVARDSLFDADLERDLASCPATQGRRVEALNFGVIGYGTAQELILYREIAAAYHPDLVLLAFFGGNDVKNNSAALSPGEPRPYYTLQGGELVLDNGFRDQLPPPDRRRVAGFVRGATNRFRVLQFARRVKNVIAYRKSLARSGTDHPAADADGAGEAGLDLHVYAPPPDASWEAAWEVTDSLVVALQRSVEADGAGFAVFTVSQGVQVNPDPAVGERALAALRAEGVADPDLLYPSRRIRALGDAFEFPVIDLVPAFRREAGERGVLFHGFASSGNLGGGHWNANGHRLAAKLVAETICAAW